MLELRYGVSFVAAGLLACSGASPTSSVMPDAGRRDANSGAGADGASGGGAVMCSQKGTINSATPLDFSKNQLEGTAGATQELEVVALVTTNKDRTAGFFIIQGNNAGVYGTTAGKAGRFEKPPALGTYPMERDGLGFGIQFLDGITISADGSATFNPSEVQLLDTASGGMVTIDAWSPAAKPGGTSVISATIKKAMFKGFTVLADGSLSQTGNGCDITVERFQFTGMNVKWPAAFPAVTAAAAIAPPMYRARTLGSAGIVHMVDP